jgi:hypothetical protein
VALALAFVATSGGLSAFFSRAFLGMWIHELGHALSAWFCGFFAFPGPWRTMVGDERSWAVRLILGGLLVGVVVIGRRSERHALTGVGGALLALFVLGAFVIPTSTARMLFSFGGDAGNLVLGPLLMLTFALPREHPIKRRWLHWGFLVIGAFAFADVASQWARAAADVAEIPFGRIDGVGLSDASVLVEQFGWSERTLVRRYTWLSYAGFVVFAVGHGLGVWRAWRAVVAAEHDEAVAASMTPLPVVEQPAPPPARRSRAPLDL